MCFSDSILEKYGNIPEKKNSSENEYLEKILPLLLLGEYYLNTKNHSSITGSCILLILYSAYTVFVS